MAKYRQVHCDFWQDSFVLDLTPEEKYFYLYLMTNSKTSQCGIYELPKRVIEMETGYNRETVEKLLQRFIDYEKIAYNEPTKEIMMINWARYNFINSPKVKKCIEKELQEVKFRPFLHTYARVLKEYGYRIDTLSIDLGEEEEQEEEEEEEKEQEEEAAANVNPFNFYQQNFGVLNPFVGEEIDHFIQDTSEAVVVESMKIALENQKPWSYAKAILKNWINKNITTIEAVEAERKAFERQKSQGGGVNGGVHQTQRKNAGHYEPGKGTDGRDEGGSGLFFQG